MTAVAEPKKKAAKKATPAVGVAAKPGDKNFDWSAEYPGEAVYLYTSSEGVTVGLAAMSEKRRPKPGVFRRLRKEPALEQMWAVIEIVASQAALDVSDEFDDADYGEMFAGWSEFSGTTPGE